MKKLRRIAGIDEAGRGPLAGPVAVGMAMYDPSDRMLMTALKKLFPVVKDSKQLSEVRREVIYEELRRLSKTTTLTMRVSLLSAATIDQRGISYAIRKGVERTTRAIDPKNTHVLLDGGLKAPEIFVHQKTYVRGDATHLPIALASIAAKVVRDRHMRKIAKCYPAYGFGIHKGYGTKTHYEAIKRKGMSVEHRRSFIHLSR